MAVFLVVPCSLLGVSEVFDASIFTAVVTLAANASETSASFYKTALYKDPEDGHLQICHRENRRSHLDG
jgi:hypothetical protein